MRKREREKARAGERERENTKEGMYLIKREKPRMQRVVSLRASLKKQNTSTHGSIVFYLLTATKIAFQLKKLSSTTA